MFGISLLVLCCILLIVYYLHKDDKSTYKNDNLEVLKNGLLSYALSKTNKDDLSSFDMNYQHYDGTKLPMFSGNSTSNACLSYIMSKTDFRKSKMYTKSMEEKITAIEKYLNKNFDTREKVTDFFEKFIDAFENKGENLNDTER